MKNTRGLARLVGGVGIVVTTVGISSLAISYLNKIDYNKSCRVEPAAVFVPVQIAAIPQQQTVGESLETIAEQLESLHRRVDAIEDYSNAVGKHNRLVGECLLAVSARGAPVTDVEDQRVQESWTRLETLYSVVEKSRE